jgi:hypothetical protein
MMLMAMALAMQPAAVAPDDRLTCAPRQIVTAAGPPPAVFVAQRIAAGSQRRMTLSVHRCRGAEGYRIELDRDIPNGPSEEKQWVPTARCAALGEWMAAATRLRLPAPMLRPLREIGPPRAGIWYTLDANTLTGSGRHGAVEIEALDPPGAAPNALGLWFQSGEQAFRACRDQGHGGEGYPGRPGR